jgi:hypothetical protein
MQISDALYVGTIFGSACVPTEGQDLGTQVR